MLSSAGDSSGSASASATRALREGLRLLELAIEPLERRLQEGAIARLYLGTIRLQPPDLGTDALTLRLGLEHDLSGLEPGLLEQHVVLAA